MSRRLERRQCRGGLGIWLMLLAGCHGASSRYRIVASVEPAPAWAPSYVILCGVDRGAPTRPPAGCVERGRIEAWARGEKAYHYGGLREGAQALGGNGVAHIRFVRRGGHRFFYEGVVLRCPLGAHALPVRAPDDRRAERGDPIAPPPSLLAGPLRVDAVRPRVELDRQLSE